jgi:hypothetical protein
MCWSATYFQILSTLLEEDPEPGDKWARVGQSSTYFKVYVPLEEDPAPWSRLAFTRKEDPTLVMVATVIN